MWLDGLGWVGWLVGWLAGWIALAGWLDGWMVWDRYLVSIIALLALVNVSCYFCLGFV